MGACCENSIIKNLIAKILYQKDILPEDYETIIDSLSKRNDENIYLIYALKYLNLSSDIIDLLIVSYETKELFYFLSEKSSEKHLCENKFNSSDFIPMTKEEALKKNFLNINNSIKIPPSGKQGEVIEKFSFYDTNTNKFFDCERKYKIDSSGQVVDFIYEKVTPQEINGIDKRKLYAGILGEEFFSENNKINQKEKEC